MTIFRHFFTALMLAGLVACAASAPQPGGDTTSTPPPGAVSAPAAPTPAPQPDAQLPAPGRKPPPMRKPVPAERVTGNPEAPNRSCRTASDCAVKDVGNCCGRFPACVNVDAKVDPAAVQAQCAASGMASTCGFREVSSCGCVQGQCQDAGDGSKPLAQ